MNTRLLLICLLAPAAVAQGPSLNYLADSGTELAFAECHIYMDGGSRHKISFLPVVNAKGAPCGTERFTRDIRLKAPITFVGSGDGYETLDVTGKFVLLGYDLPDSKASLEDRVRYALTRKAAGVVLFSIREEHPFPQFAEAAMERIPEFPVIAIGKSAVTIILASAGLTAPPAEVRPQTLITKLDLRIDGKFELLDTGNFTFAFEPRGNLRQAAAELARTSEKALRFDLELFRDADLRWNKTFTAYFADFDSKVFLMHHWGSGFSGDAGTFMVYDGKAPNFGLAAHEYAHTLIDHNWGGSSSFLVEGIGKYAEAMATDPAKNHRETTANLRAGRLFALSEMAKINIGSDRRTEVAYPAAGSFVQYLVGKHTLRKLKAVYQGASWTAAFGKDLPELETEWLEFLRYGMRR